MKTTETITDTFNDGTILITGSTGFLGKILTDKLLRSCGLLKTIAVLVRNKRGLTAEQRMTDMYNQVVFDRLRKRKPDFMNYIKVINGNIEEQSLGLSLTDRNWLIQNVNFVFHCAATVKFNEPLDLATKINVLGTTNILALAAEMKHLKGFVHVSTAYSHCPRNEIKEKYYPVPITSTELSDLLEIDALTSE
ncbi:Male sterility, NAD-binding,NAD(P)-binding domain [Cinara cedri]|uniref:Fatty acyl-CoA reductase n=1 Tax=Cinara cedri TaxID=506608 RepID=A0A5E4MQQ6_9HEMI|nr:Male sterility, NAD-binding,NAD(P)-binding domain [Cinara cedri]